MSAEVGTRVPGPSKAPDIHEILGRLSAVDGGNGAAVAIAPPTLPSRSREALALGTSEWMLPDEAARKFGLDARMFSEKESGLWEARSNGQVWFGNSLGDKPIPLGYRDDRHVCLVSGTRGGKGTSIIIPNLCLWPGSCIVIDPKGENASVTATRRGNGSTYAHALGQTVRILDPFGEVQLDPSLKARFNPLDVIDINSDFAVDDAGRIAAALVPMQNASDPFWEESARSLIKGVILHVLTSPDFADRKNLITVWRLLKQGDWLSVETLQKMDHPKIPSGFDLLWEGMRRSKAFNGLIAGVGEEMIHIAEKTGTGIRKVASENLEFMAGPPMQRLLEASDFDLAALKTDPKGITIYLTLPQRYMSTHYRWLRVMIDLAAGEMERIKGRPATGHQTLFVLDEFAGLKRMERIEDGAAQAAGAGVKYLYIVQNLPQIKETYKDSWETFLGNASLKLFFSIEDDFTRSYLSRQLGETEVRRMTESRSTSVSDSRTLTSGDSKSKTDGTSKSDTKGKSTSTGTTTGEGKTWQRGLIFFGFHKGENVSSGTSQSVSDSNSTARSSSESLSVSTSRSEAVARSDGRTEGHSDTVHKRPILNPDEIGRFLARVDDRTHSAYPGLVLVLITGEHPLLARRVNYFESRLFAGHFDPHPDHDSPRTLEFLANLLKPKPQPAAVLPPATPIESERSKRLAKIRARIVAAMLFSVALVLGVILAIRVAYAMLVAIGAFFGALF